MPARQNITLENIYKMVVDLKRDVALIKKSFMEEPELRDEFTLRMRDIDFEKEVMVEDFSKRYGIKCINLQSRKILTGNLRSSRKKTENYLC